MDITVTIGLVTFGGALAGSLLSNRLAYNTHKAELKEQRRRERIKYLQRIHEKLIAEWGTEMRNSQKLKKGLMLGIDDEQIQGYVNKLSENVSQSDLDVAIEATITRLGQMINQEMKINPDKP